MTIYLSGPITGITDYAARFDQAREYVEHLGDIEVINPAAAGHRPAWTWADWMIYDLQLLRRADALVALPWSEGSHGAKVEADFARGLGIPVIELADLRGALAQVEEWAARREA